MSKYEIEMEITGFKLKIRGERADIPVIRENLSRQVSNLIEPATNIAQQKLPLIFDAEPPSDSAHEELGSKKTRKIAPRQRRATSNGESTVKRVEWSHQPDKWGIPKQSWKAWEKIVYTLFVASHETNTQEMSAPGIVDTFNQLFRQAGVLQKKNMPRDLKDLKQRTPAVVGDNRTVAPITWFLTEEGTKIANKLVATAKGSDVKGAE